MSNHLILVILVIGLCAGILSGLVGVGGGIVLVPAMIFSLGYTQHQAQGSSLGVLTLPVVAIAFWKYYKDCAAQGTPIDLKVIGLLALGFLLGGFLGSTMALRIDQAILKKIFATVLIYTALKMLGVDQWFLGLFRKG